MTYSIEEKLKEIITEHLGVDASKVTPQALLTEDLGADSLDAMDLLVAINEEFGTNIPPRKHDPYPHRAGYGVGNRTDEVRCDSSRGYGYAAQEIVPVASFEMCGLCRLDEFGMSNSPPGATREYAHFSR